MMERGAAVFNRRPDRRLTESTRAAAQHRHVAAVAVVVAASYLLIYQAPLVAGRTGLTAHRLTAIGGLVLLTATATATAVARSPPPSPVFT